MSQRFLTIKTPLPGEDTFLVYRIAGQERLGQLFTYELELFSEDGNIDPAKLLGQRATVRLHRRSGEPRFFDGYISRFQQFEPHLDHHRVRITLVPWVWFLTRSSDCRIFQNKTVPEIVRDVFRNPRYQQVQKFDEHLSATYRTREYTVQSRETDFNFVSRLMEDEGIYYFFTHKDGEHTCVLADSPGAHEPAGLEAETLPYNPASESQIRGERVAEWSVEKDVRTDAATVNDYDFKAPRNPLLARALEATEYEAPSSEFYDYPGIYTKNADGERIAVSRLDEIQSQYDTRRGTTDAPGLQPGVAFTLEGHPRGDQNQTFLLIGTSLSASSILPSSMGAIGGDEYTCSFDCSPIGFPWRPPRHTPVPFVRGPQTATVVGPKNEEIYTDEFGRIKVQFHWDREGKNDADSSCWLRVGQFWAGKRWGASFWPRVGQEVIVAFLEGDPDQPLVIGSVYNGDQMPPYLGGGPDQKHANDHNISGVKSNTTPGGQGYNEWRFDDTKDKEQVFIHAQRNMDVRVGGSYMTTVGGSVNCTNGGVDSKGNKYGDSRQLVNKDLHLHVKGDSFVTTDGKENHIVGGDAFDWYRASHRTTVANEDFLEAPKIIIEGGETFSVKAPTIILDAAQKISIKGPGGYILIDATGVTIVGTIVKINCPGSTPAIPAQGTSGVGSGPIGDKCKEPKDPAGADGSKSGSRSCK